MTKPVAIVTGGSRGVGAEVCIDSAFGIDLNRLFMYQSNLLRPHVIQRLTQCAAGSIIPSGNSIRIGIVREELLMLMGGVKGLEHEKNGGVPAKGFNKIMQQRSVHHRQRERAQESRDAVGYARYSAGSG